MEAQMERKSKRPRTESEEHIPSATKKQKTNSEVRNPKEAGPSANRDYIRSAPTMPAEGSSRDSTVIFDDDGKVLGAVGGATVVATSSHDDLAELEKEKKELEKEKNKLEKEQQTNSVVYEKQFALVPKKPSQSDSTSIQDPDQRYLDYMEYPSGSHYSTWKKQNPTTGYTLQDLFLTQFPNCFKFILKVIENLNKVKQKSSALCHFFLKHISPADQEYCTYEEEFSCFQHLPSFVTSNRFIADCYLCMSVGINRNDKADFTSFRCERSSCNVCSNVNLKEGYFEKLNEENALPVVPIEIDSGKIWESVHKCGIAVLENLRLVRCFGLEVNEWSGFTFPNSTRKEAVIQVTVKTTSERPFFFSVATEFLTMDSVKNAVVTVYRKQKQILSTVQDSQLDSAFVFKLSESELASLAADFDFMTSIGSNKGFRCAQNPSITSLMLYCCNEEAAYFLKHLIGAKQRDNLQRIEAIFRDCKSDHPVLLSYKACVLKETLFHCFVAKPKPLNTLEARCCLKQFVHLVSTSLQRLHEDYHLAHTDVRTDNICFIDDGSRAIFIDIDRCSKTDKIVDEKWCTKKSALYHSEFTNEKIDWRQLGCTIYWILKRTSPKPCDSIHELDVTNRRTVTDELIGCGLDENSVPFVCDLIFEGKYEDTKNIFSDVKYSMSVMEVLQRREQEASN